MNPVQKLAMGMILFIGTGCATPRYAANWDRLQVGMTKDQVRNVLGNPDVSSARSGPTRVEIRPSSSMPAEDQEMMQLAAKNALKSFWDWSELWQYGGAAWLKMPIFAADDDAFGVYFDNQGKVMRYQGPRKGCNASTSQASTLGPYKYVDTNGIRIGGDYEDALSDYTEGPVSPELKPPDLLCPSDKAVFDHYPRLLAYTWRPSQGTPKDAKYLVQTEFTWKGDYTHFGEWDNQTKSMFTYLTHKTSMSKLFMGAQPGRWRVKVIHGSTESEWSAWRYFRFTR